MDEEEEEEGIPLEQGPSGSQIENMIKCQVLFSEDLVYSTPASF